jgi:hypothetical protein
LFEFHYDIGRRACNGVLASQDRIDPAAAKRKPVLQKYFDVTETGLDQIVTEHGYAPGPSASLPGRRFWPVAIEGPFEHQLGDTACIS